jgi:hypothetical protein
MAAAADHRPASGGVRHSRAGTVDDRGQPPVRRTSVTVSTSDRLPAVAAPEPAAQSSPTEKVASVSARE